MKRLARYVLRGGRRDVGPAGPLVARPRLIILDFDGTIADTFEIGLEILNLLAPEFGYRPLTKEDLPYARNMRTKELMKFLGIPATKLRRISKRGTEELNKRIKEIQPISGIPEALHIAQREGFHLGIVTSNSHSNVTTFLRQHNLEIFDFIRSSSKLLGKGRIIRQLMKELSLEPSHMLFVGDETRDIEAAQETGIHMAAVTWGYNSRCSIESFSPDYVLDSPEDLLKLLFKLPS